MTKSLSPFANWRSAFGIVLALYLFAGFAGRASADSMVPEHVRLAAILRHINTIEWIMAQEALSLREERSRYHFDYARLREDLQRVRTGIHDYLAPPRAQPRDPVELLGDYRQSDRSSNMEEDQ